ncbi:MAG: hypothetical protein LBJ61_00515 [Deltaproteobacteria bacterium]|jgi:hypothetical protein|nr:hypothetical protein [Deltaproteobacteria bacterium]
MMGDLSTYNENKNYYMLNKQPYFNKYLKLLSNTTTVDHEELRLSAIKELKTFNDTIFCKYKTFNDSFYDKQDTIFKSDSKVLDDFENKYRKLFKILGIQMYDYTYYPDFKKTDKKPNKEEYIDKNIDSNYGYNMVFRENTNSNQHKSRVLNPNWTTPSTVKTFVSSAQLLRLKQHLESRNQI